MTYDDIVKVNSKLTATDIKGKSYMEVNQRIKAFRMLYPTGTIETEMLSNENGICVFKAKVGYTNPFYEDGKIKQLYTLLGTGTAYEKEGSTFINKTSYIENCETSAVGRALAMCGIGIDTSVASAEEVQNAINNQEITVDDALNYVFDKGKHKGKTIATLYDEDKNYLQWWLDNGKDESIKQMIQLITDMKPTEIKTDEELSKIVKLQELVNATNADYESLKKYYGVESDIEMSEEQLDDAIKKLEARL